MTSTLTLFKNCLVEPDKNFIVDMEGGKNAIEYYLNTLEKEVITDFQYIKHDLTLTIKVSKNQSALMMGENSQDINYCKIQNGLQNPCYYFIIEKYWKSENTIELVLNMDTLNTFEFNSDYVITAKSKVLREHRDRYIEKVFYDVLDENNIAVRTDHYYIDTQEWWGEVTTLPNSKLVGIANYEIQIVGGTATLNTTTGQLHIVATGGAYDGDTIYVYYKVVINKGSQVYKNIDFVDEGINPQLYRGGDNEIIQPVDTSWNLIYKNANEIAPEDYNQVNPVNCYLAPDTPIRVTKGSTYKIVDFNGFQEGKYYYIAPSNNGNQELIFRDGGGLEYNLQYSRTINAGYTNEKMTWLVIYRANGNNYFTIELHSYSKIYHGNIVDYYDNRIISTRGSITSIAVLSNIDSVNYALAVTNSFPLMDTTISGSFTFTTTDAYLNSLESLDRTDSKLIKIIKLPYCPSSYGIDMAGNITIDEKWEYDSTTTFFKLTNLNSKFKYEMDAPFNDPLLTLLDVPESFNPFTSRNIEYETKLLNSEFYYPKFVYDSFGFEFDLEKVDVEKYMNSKEIPNFKYGFVTTTTINSKFMFYFPNYILQDYKKNGDYDNFLPIARNNEVVLYNNQYINYLRTGYNYDLKNKNRTEAVSGVSTALGVIGAVASIGLAVASGNPAVAVGGVIGGVSTMTASVMGNINTIAREESNMASKIEQLKAQSTSVAGSDDIDLLEAYSRNRAKMTEYRVSDKMKYAIYDLFYYFGYKTFEMKIPNVQTRCWFNFLQAELDIKQTSNLSSIITDDIKEKFKNGVTFMHTIFIDDDPQWNFDQDKENWEVALVGGVIPLGGNE